jgi:hypothetical protein
LKKNSREFDDGDYENSTTCTPPYTDTGPSVIARVCKGTCFELYL